MMLWAAACILGSVTGPAGPIAGATVRVQATARAAKTDAAGEFTLCPPDPVSRLALTASATAYYIGGPISARPGDHVKFALSPLPRNDNPSYRWVSPLSETGEERSCQLCHSASDWSSALPFDEWRADAHGRAARNPRFLSVYSGTDLTGEHLSPATRFVADRDYGRSALKPNPRTPYFGPGFQLDFPGKAGNCAACHAPAAAARAPYTTRPEHLGVGDGITCDFCHKAAEVQIDPATQRPYANTPGILSFRFLRPGGDRQLFLGPLDDVAPSDDAYSELHQQSRFCAPCHSAQFWGVAVYDSFGEWLDSDYSRPASGRARTCQDCHMPSRGAVYIARFEKGGLRRNSGTLRSHLMRGPEDEDFMRQAARLDLEVRRDGDTVAVTARVNNSGTGHSLPTGHPGRNVVLLIVAQDDSGTALPLVSGPLLPDWSGLGGRAGKAFAHVLEERWTRVAPTIAYWTPIRMASDTRIRAMEVDTSEYLFRAPETGTVRVTGRLIYRRMFPEIARLKRWTDPVVLMQEKAVTVTSRDSLCWRKGSFQSELRLCDVK